MAHHIDLSGQDILTYLQTHENKSLLRFITCGSVDDGKSTLIGRLLYESKLVYEDQLAALEADSKKVGTQGGDLDFALLVDGLAAEREQGITIDVAYRFFSTDRRKFIVADTPGHEQYTRNMVTGASTADLAVILIDARKGVLTQTRRHSTSCPLLGIRLWAGQHQMDSAIIPAQPSRRSKRTTASSRNRSVSPNSAFRYCTQGRKSGAQHQNHALVRGLQLINTSIRRCEKDFAPPPSYAGQWVKRPNSDFRGSRRVVRRYCRGDRSGRCSGWEALVAASHPGRRSGEAMAGQRSR